MYIVQCTDVHCTAQDIDSQSLKSLKFTHHITDTCIYV